MAWPLGTTSVAVDGIAPVAPLPVNVPDVPLTQLDVELELVLMQ